MFRVWNGMFGYPIQLFVSICRHVFFADMFQHPNQGCQGVKRSSTPWQIISLKNSPPKNTNMIQTMDSHIHVTIGYLKHSPICHLYFNIFFLWRKREGGGVFHGYLRWLDLKTFQNFVNFTWHLSISIHPLDVQDFVVTLYLNLSFENSKGWNKKLKKPTPMSKKDVCLCDFVCGTFLVFEMVFFHRPNGCGQWRRGGDWWYLVESCPLGSPAFSEGVPLRCK